MRRFQRPAIALASVAMLIILWELGGRTQALGPSFPPATAVGAYLTDPARTSLLTRAFGASASSAAIGLGLGLIVACAIVFVGVLVKPARAGTERLATAVHAIPSLAFAPVLIVTAGPDTTPALIAAIGSYFPIYVALAAGLAAIPPSYGDLANALGATALTRLRHLELPHLIPSLIDALRLGAPAAVIGTIIGEWFGARSGLGLLIIAAMQNYFIPQLWAAALIAALMSIIAYGLLSAVHTAVVGRYAY